MVEFTTQIALANLYTRSNVTDSTEPADFLIRRQRLAMDGCSAVMTKGSGGVRPGREGRGPEAHGLAARWPCTGGEVPA